MFPSSRGIPLFSSQVSAQSGGVHETFHPWFSHLSHPTKQQIFQMDLETPPEFIPVLFFFGGGFKPETLFAKLRFLSLLDIAVKSWSPTQKRVSCCFAPSILVGLLHVSLKHHKNNWIAHILKPFQSDLQNTHPLNKGHEPPKAWKSWGKFRIQVSCYSLRVRWHVGPTQTPADDHQVDSTLRVGLGDICVIYTYPISHDGSMLVYLPANLPYKSTSKCR